MRTEWGMKTGPSSILMFMAMSGMLKERQPKRTWLDDVDILAEYELIQQKKSKLSAAKRQAVVSEYRRLTEPKSTDKKGENHGN